MYTEPDPSQKLEEEIELLRRVGEGDRGSFEKLYDRFADVVIATAYRILNSHEAAEDVAQEVFVQIWEKAALYDASRGKPMTWAIVLARNKAIDRMRAIRRREQTREKFEKEESVFAGFDEKDSFEVMSSSETGAMVREAIGRLPTDQVEVIELAFAGSLTHTEIAEKLGVPLGTIKGRIRRAMMKLREIIEREQ